MTRLCRNAKKSKVKSKARKKKKEEKNQKKNLHGLVLFSGKIKQDYTKEPQKKKKNRTKHRTSPTKVSRIVRDSQEKNRKRTSLGQSKK